MGLWSLRLVRAGMSMRVRSLNWDAEESQTPELGC